MFDSLQCARLHEILQARILEWVAISYYWASSQPRDRTPISHTGRQILYHWATREAQWRDTGQICGTETAIRLMLHFNREETSSEQSFMVFFFFINTIIWKKKFFFLYLHITLLSYFVSPDLFLIHNRLAQDHTHYLQDTVSEFGPGKWKFWGLEGWLLKTFPIVIQICGPSPPGEALKCNVPFHLMASITVIICSL